MYTFYTFYKQNMQYKVLHDNPAQDIFTRLAQVRNIEDDIKNFLNPTYEDYRIDVWKLPNIHVAIERICKAIEQNEKIMIFGDYDVDGICASYVMYTFFRKFLWYKNISIRLPHRMKDGYGLKSHHLDEIKELGCTLVITVDNGITARAEAKHAHDIWLDLIITDHHKVVKDIPDAFAVVNPQIDEQYPFPEICGATVAFKVCMALAEKQGLGKQDKKAAHDRLLPFITIATVTDVMPLIKENRLIVKNGLRLMNKGRKRLAPSLRQFLVALNIRDKIDTYHCWFIIGPRLNATGRMDDAMEGLMAFLISNREAQIQQLTKIEQMNDERRKIQQQMVLEANKLIDPKKILLVAASENFHEGIVGIVAGRITEHHYKPSLILKIDSYNKQAVGSLRGPEYFNIVEMLKTADDLLLRYGGHAQAWGMSIHLDDLDVVLERFHKYAQQFEEQQKSERVLPVDTKIYSHELSNGILDQVKQFGPYGEGNPEPLFQIEEVIITHASTMGKGERTHLKLQCKKEGNSFSVIQRGAGDTIDQIQRNTPLTIIGKIKADSYNGGFYVEGVEIGR